VLVRDVGARDGIQSLPLPLVPLEVKERLVSGLAAAGLRRIEAGSFVSPRAVPQMADSEALFATPLDATLEALVVNERGAKAAVDAGAQVLVGVVAVSDAFSHRNVGQSTADAIRELGTIASVAHDCGLPLTVDLATAFGCAYTGPVAVADVARVAGDVAQLGVEEITLADTIGAAAPTDITAAVASVGDAVGGDVAIGLHLHDTRGLGLANVCAGLDAGIRRFDASVGGLGGCPFSPGATGNICTEDLVHLLEALGFETGIDLDALIAVSAALEADLGLPLPSHVLRAGPRFRRRDTPVAD
jgi:hydroxymethylglutaryl-CoA lyase